MEDEVLFEQETSEEIQEEFSEYESENSEEEEVNEEVVESTEQTVTFKIDYERLESAVLQDDFNLDSDLDDLFLTDALLLFVVFVLLVIFASKEV